MVIPYAWANVESKYKCVYNMYLSAHPCVFRHSVFMMENIILNFFDITIIHIQRAAVFEEYGLCHIK